MRYCTKEWFEKMQRTSLHLLLRASERAEELDEEFFRELYEEKLAERIKLDRTCAELAEEDFDEARARREFAARHKSAVKRLEGVLPEEILSRTADVRVLALDVCSQDVMRRITAFCEENERDVERTLEELEEAERKEWGGELPDFTRENLHDCEIISCKKSGKNIVMELDCSGGFTNARRVVFKNAEVVLREGRQTGRSWLYDEIYKAGDGAEIHALLLARGEPEYFTVRCSGAEFFY